MLPPHINDIVLQRAAGRAIIVKTSSTTIDFEGGSVEHAPSQHGIEDGPVKGLTLEGSCVGHDGIFRLFDLWWFVFVSRGCRCELSGSKVW